MLAAMHRRFMWLAITVCTLAVTVACGDDETASGNGAGSGGAATGGNGSGGATAGQGGANPNCYAGGVCAPTTPNDCGTKGEACDITSTKGFQCFAPPNTAMLGEACDEEKGPTCAHSMGCLGGKCAKFCCINSDCPSNSCVPPKPDASTFFAFCAP